MIKYIMDKYISNNIHVTGYIVQDSDSTLKSFSTLEKRGTINRVHKEHG